MEAKDSFKLCQQTKLPQCKGIVVEQNFDKSIPSQVLQVHCCWTEIDIL